MADKPIVKPLPGDLPEDWKLEQIVSPNGTEAGLTVKHGYNYLMAQINAAQAAINAINEAFPGLAGLGADGRVPPEQLPSLDYVPSAEKGKANGVATLGADGKVPTAQLQPTADSLNFGPNGSNGLWDRQTAVPTGTMAIRYNGYLRATRVYGMYYSDAADYAEAYPVEGDAAPGELVALGENGVLRRCARALDPRVVGVASTDPAAVIGGDGVALALAGRVPVKVAGPVRAGDFLAASDVPGRAMAVDLGAAPRGSVVGMALEAGADTVTALVMRL